MTRKTTFYPKTAEEREAVRTANATGSVGALNAANLTLVPDKKGTCTIVRIGKVNKPK